MPFYTTSRKKRTTTWPGITLRLSVRLTTGPLLAARTILTILTIHGLDTMRRDGRHRRESTSKAGRDGSALSMGRLAARGFARNVLVSRPRDAGSRNTK